MGYCVTVDGRNFCIKEENISKKTLRVLDSFGYDGWNFKYDDNDNIIKVSYFREKYHSDMIALFKGIANIVVPGSYIEFHGEDGALWRWIFDGSSVKEIKPKIIWE